MKVSKKDKIVLLVLFFVIIIGVFLMYGVIPANNELKELKAKEAELETELQRLQGNYNIHNPNSKITEMENLLNKYYTSLDSNDDIIFVNSELEAYFHFKPLCMELKDSLYYNVNIDKKIESDRETIKRDPIKQEISSEMNEKHGTSLLKASAVFTFTVNSIEEVADILNTIDSNPNFDIVNFKYSLVDGHINGSTSIVKYYIESTRFIPLPLVDDPNNFNLVDLEDAPARPIIDPEKKTLSFNTIKNANYYEIYEVIYKTNEQGNIEFSKYSSSPIMTQIKPTLDASGRPNLNVEVKYDGKLLQSSLDEKHYYVIVAVGNYEQCWYGKPEGVDKVYYRTIMSQYLADNKFEVA